jgi:cytoplasmic tRNA 2-thiolation protein 2
VRNSAPDQQRKILLPISFGVSSVTLLNILDHHLKTQMAKTGRTGFSLHVLFVDSSRIHSASPNADLLSGLQKRYPDHQYITAALEDVFQYAKADDSLLELLPGNNVDTPSLEQISTLMNSLTSATARADVLPILRTRLIVEEAKRLGCEGILWGDSTTRLAEKTLTETAKGRGFSLPWQTADGESAFGITFNYPLRDLLKKELVSYINILEPSLDPLVSEPSTTVTNMSSRNTTIDDLMKEYFESVEENFPSIVSNVVRTTGKLEASPGSASNPRCSLCNMPVPNGQFGIHGWGGDQQDGLAPSSSDTSQGLCYGCTRSIPQPSVSANGSS